MRCVGKVKSLGESQQISRLLSQRDIDHIIEPVSPSDSQQVIWIVDEDKFQQAKECLSSYFQSIKAADPNQEFQVKTANSPISLKIRKLATVHSWVTYVVMSVCVILFIVAFFEKKVLIEENGKVIGELVLPEVQKQLMFDYPLAAENLDEGLRQLAKRNKNLAPARLSVEIEQVYEQTQKTPSWEGIYPLFLRQKGRFLFSAPFAEKICHWQLWRLFTPNLLHTDLLHIVFNMAWLWMLGSQVEKRLRAGRFVFLVLVLGVFSGLCQYIMSGPFFLGFSGVVVGLAAFIAMRKRVAPWEGYSIHTNTLRFLFVFVVSMFALELVALLLRSVFFISITPNIANTAHVAGGLLGLLLGKSSFFSRRIHR